MSHYHRPAYSDASNANPGDILPCDPTLDEPCGNDLRLAREYRATVTYGTGDTALEFSVNSEVAPPDILNAVATRIFGAGAFAEFAVDSIWPASGRYSSDAVRLVGNWVIDDRPIRATVQLQISSRVSDYWRPMETDPMPSVSADDL
jgi:hypothetical protein